MWGGRGMSCFEGDLRRGLGLERGWRKGWGADLWRCVEDARVRS